MSDNPRSFGIDVQHRSDASVITVRGDVDVHTSPEFREQLISLLDSPTAAGPGARRLLILDLSGVGYMDSSGVGTIVDLKRRADRRGGGVVLAGLQPRVRSVFEITRLDHFFKIVGSVEQARDA